MKKVTLMCGASGSGKSYFLSKFADDLFDKKDTMFISSDDVRAELFPGKEFDPSQNSDVWEGERSVKSRVARALSEGKHVVIDATFANRAQRYEFIQYAREHGADRVEGIFIEVPLEIALERNGQRSDGKVAGERLVDPAAIRGMHRQLSELPPGITDGFDALITVGSDLKPVYEKMIDPADSGKFITREFK